MLYILILQNKKAFKVGITIKEDLTRIKGLHSIYNFDLNNSYLVNFKNYKTLERQIHTDYKQYQYTFDIKQDGSTEFLHIDCLQYVLEDIEFKAKRFNFDIKKGISITQDKPVKTPKNKKQKEITPLKFNEAFEKYYNMTNDDLKDFIYRDFKNIMLPIEYLCKRFEFMCKQVAINRHLFEVVGDTIKCKNLFLGAFIYLDQIGNEFDVYKDYCVLYPNLYHKKILTKIINN